MKIEVEHMIALIIIVFGIVVTSMFYMNYDRDLQFIKEGYTQCFQPSMGYLWKKGGCN